MTSTATTQGDTMAPSTFLADLPLAGTLVGTDFTGWSTELREEFQTHAEDGNVGSRLLSQTPRARVWEIRLAPGERWHAHRHVLD
jgi:beta-alanine degradation protein BauB